MLIPYLNLTADERAQIVQQELAENRITLTEEPTTINGHPATVLACKQWGVIALGNRLLGLDRYPLIKLDNISTGPQEEAI
jgi:hypothetical protein